MVVSSVGCYAARPAAVGAAPGMDGFYGMGLTDMLYADSDLPAVRKFYADYKAKFGKDPNVGAIYGYVGADLTVQGLKNAGKDLTLDSFIKGMEAIKDSKDLFGGPPATFGPNIHGGTFTASDESGDARVFTHRVEDFARLIADRLQRGAGRLKEGEQRVRFITGIDEHGTPSIGVHDQPRVLLKRADRRRGHTHHAPRTKVGTGSGAGCPLFRAVRNFSTAIAAVVASPTAVVTWRVSCTRTSPAANKPGIEVCMLASVSR